VKRILLTSVFGPYGPGSKYNKAGDEEWFDYFTSRLTKEKGPFALSTYPTGTSLQLIAANLDADVTVLWHPTLDEYVAELKKGWDFVGIGFKIKGLGKIFPMIAAARKHAPQAKVVIGGFGTVLHGLDNTGADYVCKGEGVRYMRELIGQDVDAPTRQPLVTSDITLKLFRDYDFLPRVEVAQLTHGFGCPNRCDFCVTSAFYGGRHIPFTTGRAFYDAMAEVHAATGISNFWIFEEDLCLYQDSVREWGGLIRDDPERAFSWACFSSVKSLSAWDLEELVAMGLNHVWIGVESLDSSLAKREGKDIAAIFRDLHDMGVTTTGSIIVGLDHHTPDNFHVDLDYFIKLYPTTTQIGTLMPADGTEERRRLDELGRVRKASYKDADLYSEILIHPNFKPGQLRETVFDAYDQFYAANGPALHRALRGWLAGARRFKSSTSKSLRRRAELCAQRALTARPIFLDTLDYLPNQAVRASVEDTLARLREEFGAPSAEDEARARLVARVFALEEARGEVFPRGPIEPAPSVRRWASGVEVAAGATGATAVPATAV